MPVKRSEVTEAQLFKEHPGNKQPLKPLFKFRGNFYQTGSLGDARLGKIFQRTLETIVDGHGDYLIQISAYCSDIGRDR